MPFSRGLAIVCIVFSADALLDTGLCWLFLVSRYWDHQYCFCRCQSSLRSIAHLGFLDMDSVSVPQCFFVKSVEHDVQICQVGRQNTWLLNVLIRFFAQHPVQHTVFVSPPLRFMWFGSLRANVPKRWYWSCSAVSEFVVVWQAASRLASDLPNTVLEFFVAMCGMWGFDIVRSSRVEVVYGWFRHRWLVVFFWIVYGSLR